LKGPRGNVETYIVDKEVKRLGEIKVGDTVTADYKVAAIAELREPTEEEKGEPVTLREGSDRAPSDKPPGAVFARAIRLVATIESVDAATRTFAVRGPLEGTVKFRLDPGADLASVFVGKAVVVMFVETLLLSVEPGAK
jgi:hypothetical protein